MELLAQAEALLGELAVADFAELGEVELTTAMLGVQRLRGSFEVTEAHAVRAFDRAGVWALDGARSAASWLAWRRHLPPGEARRLVRQAHVTAALPTVEQAWVAGDIGAPHVGALERLDTPRTHAAFLEGHAVLVDAARTQPWRLFTRACAYWAMHADPDGAEQSAAVQREARSVQLHQSFDGQWFGKLTLDPVSGAVVHETLQTVEQELFEADWAAARERLGHTPNVRELGRSPAQRRADALVELCARARSAPADGQRPRPLFSVLVGYESFAGPVCELFDRTVLTPAAAAAWLNEADVERIVFDTPSRVIDVGRPARFYRGALRHAIEIRDRTCWHPTCDERPVRPEIDHIDEFAQGGATTEANGRWGCGFHNRHRTTPRDWLSPPGERGWPRGARESGTGDAPVRRSRRRSDEGGPAPPAA